MKTCLTVLVLLTSIKLLAYPNVGDRVEWSGVAQVQKDSPVPLIISKEIIGFETTKDEWTVQYKITLGEKSITKIFIEKQIFTPAQSKKILDTCLEKGGLLEDLETTVGVYKTCKLTTFLADGTVIEKWWGDIPFGIVSKNTRSSSRNETLPVNIEALFAGM